MLTRYFALIVGIVYLLVGIIGFIPGIVQPPAAGDPALAISAGYGRLLGPQVANGKISATSARRSHWNALF